jgi:hypothetical protein
VPPSIRKQVWIGLERQPMAVDGIKGASPLQSEASMAVIAFEDDAFLVLAVVIGHGLDLDPPTVQSLMSSGELTSLCERGENGDAGRYRLTFFYRSRRFQLIIDSSGKILWRSAIDFGERPLPNSLRKPGL